MQITFIQCVYIRPVFSVEHTNKFTINIFSHSCAKTESNKNQGFLDTSSQQELNCALWIVFCEWIPTNVFEFISPNKLIKAIFKDYPLLPLKCFIQQNSQAPSISKKTGPEGADLAKTNLIKVGGPIETEFLWNTSQENHDTEIQWRKLFVNK